MIRFIQMRDIHPKVFTHPSYNTHDSYNDNVSFNDDDAFAFNTILDTGFNSHEDYSTYPYPNGFYATHDVREFNDGGTFAPDTAFTALFDRK